MIERLGIDRSAHLLILRHGAYARLTSMMRAAELPKARDMERAAVWRGMAGCRDENLEIGRCTELP